MNEEEYIEYIESILDRRYRQRSLLTEQVSYWEKELLRTYALLDGVGQQYNRGELGRDHSRKLSGDLKRLSTSIDDRLNELAKRSIKLVFMIEDLESKRNNL